MTVFQMVVVGLGVVLGGSVIWGEIPKGFFKRKQPSNKPEPSIEKDVEQEVKKESSVDNVSTISELTQMVIVWENLISQCKKNKLMQACNELEKIFPLLVKVDKIQMVSQEFIPLPQWQTPITTSETGRSNE
jgi:hypothetical protein